MKTRMNRFVVGVLSCLLCGSGILLWTGCDTASSTESLVVSPSSVTLAKNQSQTFTVSGGYSYSWGLEGSTSTNGAQGSLSSLTGSQVLYTAPASVTAGGTVSLTVRSTIEGSGSTSSNSSAYEVTGEALITFK